ncbi:LacI family DNA-binding transcriptional regulator [Cryobacterium sp. N21]|uniref:LacI family DNA-binding transcriptional regulator n=1 Tax=Cryobacterium sp. N21 TaxID=2048289 RepID=UPI000CE53D54|nr:LacI family DNA-binding transcriptional regulator [Cryobacterium sp. N21]
MRDPGARDLPTQAGIKDVARVAAVSVSLVSLALNGRPGVSETTRAHIRAIANELRYTANQGARALRTGRSEMVGVLARNLSNPFFLDVLVAAQAEADASRSTIMMVDSHYSVERETEHLLHMAAQRFDGLAIAPTGSGSSIEVWTRQRPGTPVVVLNARAVEFSGVVHVGPADDDAVDLAVGHLTSIGHRRIGMMTAPSAVVADRSRLIAFQRHAEQRGGREFRIIETALDLESVRENIRAVLLGPNPPTALITSSDHTAQAVYAAAALVGAKIGRDLSVVGHDDLSTSAFLDPPLTTVRLSRSSIGRETLRRLLDASVTEDHVEPVQLIVRGSTAPVP